MMVDGGGLMIGDVGLRWSGDGRSWWFDYW